MKEELDSVPEQQKGSESNNEESVTLTNEEEAKAFYKEVKNRLLQVNSWQQYAGAATAEFILCNAEGGNVNRAPQTGDYFKIDIPGPGPVTGDGFDWVVVEAVDETHEKGVERTIIRVRPASNPTNNKGDVAHFFSEEATSNFIVERTGNKVTAAVLGRNETPNTSAEKVVDKARNAAVATGAVTAFSKLQWKSLVKGLLKK